MQNNYQIKRPCLYIVGTPIGNLLDFTMRAKLTLNYVDLILAEDTRKSRILLDFYQIKTDIRSFHNWNEKKNAGIIAENIKTKKLAYALISDAGMPQISDPGFVLVKRCIEMSIDVITIPGPSALTAAASLSDLPLNKFVFEGFLSRRKDKLLKELVNLEHETRGMIFFEAPHRILGFLKCLQKVFGSDRYIIVARELTKIFETCYRGTVKEVELHLKKSPNECKGEFTLIVSGRQGNRDSSVEIERWLAILLSHNMDIKNARSVLKEFGIFKRNLIYESTLKKG